MISTKLVNKEIKIIIDKNSYLQILKTEDVSETYVDWLNDYEVTKFTEQKNSIHSIESVKEYVNQKYNSKYDYLFGIYCDSEHIGNIKLGPIKWQHKISEISFFIGNKKFWGQGIATKAVTKLVEYAINNLDLKKIEAGFYDLNIGSTKVFKKCGFIVEGIKVSSAIFEDKRIDSIIVGYRSKKI